MTKANTMNVSLTPELEIFAKSLVKTGRYNSASEVVRDSLRLLEEKEARTIKLGQLIRQGIDSGEPITYSRGRLQSSLLKKAAILRNQDQ